MDNQPDTSNDAIGQPVSVPVQWKQHIPADVRDMGFWSNFKDDDLSSVLKTAAHAQSQLGKSVVIPQDPADEEGWNKVYSKLRPAEAKDYQLTLPEVNGFKWDDSTLEGFREAAHSVGMSQKQAEKLIDWFSNDLKAKVEAGTSKGLEQAAVTETKLRKELDKNYDVDMAFAKRAGALYFGNEATEAWFDTMPEPVIRGLVKLGKQLAEDKVFGTNPQELQGVTNREQALQKIATITGDRSHPYWQVNMTPAKKQALEEMESLHRIAYPNT